ERQGNNVIDVILALDPLPADSTSPPLILPEARNRPVRQAAQPPILSALRELAHLMRVGSPVSTRLLRATPRFNEAAIGRLLAALTSPILGARRSHRRNLPPLSQRCERPCLYLRLIHRRVSLRVALLRAKDADAEGQQPWTRDEHFPAGRARTSALALNGSSPLLAANGPASQVLASLRWWEPHRLATDNAVIPNPPCHLYNVFAIPSPRHHI